MSARDRIIKNYSAHHGCKDMKLRAHIVRNGTRQYSMFCMEPDGINEWSRHRKGPNIPHHLVIEFLKPLHMILDDVPVIIDDRCEECGGSGCAQCSPYQCERCSSYTNVEYHHWAPRHLFEDAGLWPCSWLCRKCHMEWHNIVTPNMHMRRAG